MIGRLLVLLVLMGGTFGSSSEELKGASGCADHEVLPGEFKYITTFREEEGSVYLYPTDTQTKIHVTLHLTPSSRAQGHAFSLKDLCIDDLSKWYKITIRTSVDYVRVNDWAFVVSNENCEKKFATDYLYCCNWFDALDVVAIGSSLWRNEEPGPDCLPQSSATTVRGSSSFPSDFSATTASSSHPKDPESISESSGDNSRMMNTIITISVVGSAIIIAITVFLVFLSRRRRRRPSALLENPQKDLYSTPEEPVYANTTPWVPLNASPQQEEPVYANIQLQDLSSSRGRGSAHETINSIYGMIMPRDTFPGDGLLQSE